MAAELSKEPDIERLIKVLSKDDWMVKTGVGGIFGAAAMVAILYSYICLPISVAAWALVSGYCLRAMRHRLVNMESKLPDWNEWSDLFISGLTWIALQTFVWILAGIFNLLVFSIVLAQALASHSPNLSFFYVLLGCLFITVSTFMLSLLSSYLMVHFALEENGKAGLAFIKVSKVLLKNSKKLISGFFLASGIQLASLLIPVLTVIGVFLLPSVFFVGQVLSSSILALHWSAAGQSAAQNTEAETEAKRKKS